MSGTEPSAKWSFLVSPRWLAWHAFAIVSGLGMLALGYWQYRRAESGNTLSWAYTFEWPIFTVFVLVFWIKTIIDERRQQGGTAGRKASVAGLDGDADAVALPRAAHTAASTGGGTGADPGEPGALYYQDDPELAAYNAYLAGLNKKRRAR